MHKNLPPHSKARERDTAEHLEEEKTDVGIRSWIRGKNGKSD